MKQAQEWLRAFCPSVYILTQAHYTSKSQLKEDLLKEEDDGSFPRVVPPLFGGGGEALKVSKFHKKFLLFPFDSFLSFKYQKCKVRLYKTKIKHNETK